MQLPIPAIKCLNSMFDQRTLLQLLDNGSPATITLEEGSAADAAYNQFVQELVNMPGARSIRWITEVHTSSYLATFSTLPRRREPRRGASEHSCRTGLARTTQRP